MKKPYEHIQEFLVKYCDVDFKDELKISTALAYFEEVACASADELGFGYEFVKPRGYAFMVTNLCCEFVKPIHISRIVRFKTWPTPPSHVIFGREYQILSLDDEVLANASSRWCLMDMQTGRILQSKVIENQDYSTYNTAKALENVSWKIPNFKPEEGVLKYMLTVANSDYDHNMHVNNTKYADYCMNCFSVAELAEKTVKRFSISYVKQCKEGETLRFYLKALGSGEYLAHGFNENGQTVVQSHIVFGE